MLSGQHHPNQRWAWVPRYWSRSPKGWVLACSILVMVVLSLFRYGARSKQASSPQLRTVLTNGRLRPSWELHSRARGARARTWPGPGCMLGQSGEIVQSNRQFQFNSSTLFSEQASVNILFMSRVCVSHSRPASSTGLQTSQEESSSWCWTPWLVCPICGLNHSLLKEDL